MNRAQIIVTDQPSISEAVFKVLSSHFNIKRVKKMPGFFSLLRNKIFILELDSNAAIPNIKNPIVIINNRAKDLESQARLIINSDNHKSETNCLSFGFKPGADFLASDVHNNSFKISHQSSIVPFWIKNATKDQIYVILAAVACAKALNINLVASSEALRD